MSNPTQNGTQLAVPRHPFVPHAVVSMAIGAVFLVSVLLAAALPALAAVYLVVGFAIRNVVAILVLWAASATLTVLLYQFISRTYVRTVLRRRVVERLPLRSSNPE